MHFAILMIASLRFKESRSEWAKFTSFLFRNNISLQANKVMQFHLSHRRLLLTIKQQSNMWNLIEALPYSIHF